MNCSDFEYIEEDKFTGETYGEFGQIRVLGICGLSGRTKAYAVKCNICSEDPELYGEGIFRSYRSNLQKGQNPCGCSKFTIWTEEQQRVRVSRKAAEYGKCFIDFAEKFKGTNTKLILLCCKHGLWDTTSLQALITQGHTCVQCCADNISNKNRKSTENLIANFFSTGAYAEGTIFSRPSGRVGKKWSVYCPTCDTENSTYTSHLKKGARSCLCGPSKQRQAYINIVKDGETPIAIKFGIAFDYRARVYTQNLKSAYVISNLAVWEFSTVSDCKSAENVCMKELITGILNKFSVPDGYTETTYLSNIDKVIKIYEQYGGQVIVNSSSAY